MSSTTPCPICGRAVAPPRYDDVSAEPRPFPFCSARCRAVDLGRWLSESYRIPGASVEEDDEVVAPRRGPRLEEDPDA